MTYILDTDDDYENMYKITLYENDYDCDEFEDKLKDKDIDYLYNNDNDRDQNENKIYFIEYYFRTKKDYKFAEKMYPQCRIKKSK